MKYVSVCAGIEAASVAWHPLGWEPVLFSEIEPFPCAVLRHHYPTVKLVGDFTQLIQNPPEADLLVGGTPCQAFSVAGKRLSLEDYRGNLSLAFADLAHAMEVPYVLWENVPGVLSTKDNAFGCFLGRLVGEEQPLVPDGGKWDNAGLVVGPAYTAAWRVLDAQYFGVAQRRRRVFVFACRGAGNWAAPGVLFPVAEGVRGDPAPRREAGQDPAGTLAARASAGGGLGTDFDCAGGVVTHPLKAEGADGSEDGTGRGEPLVVQEYLGNAEGGAEEVPFLTAANVGKCVNNQTPLVGVGSPVPIAMRQREGKPGGGKGPLLSANVSLTLAAGGNDQTIFAPAVVAPTLSASNDPSRSPQSAEVTAQVAAVVAAQAIPLNTQVGLREHKDGDGTGLGIGEPGDPAYTLQAGHSHAVFAIQNPGTEKAQNGLGVSKGPMYTLESARQHGVVVVDKQTAQATEDVTSTLKTDLGHQMGPVVMSLTSEQTPKFADDLAQTVTKGSPTGGGHPQCVAGGTIRPRRLTPRECERLQGFPDDYTLIPWKKGLAVDGLRYKALGNSMAVPVMHWIGKRIQLVESL